MNNAGLYVGIVLTARTESGEETVRYHGHGPDYHTLTEQDAVLMEAALMPLADEMDELGKKAEAILLQAGFAKAGVTPPAGSPGKSGR